ncbi:MAG: hypothetical protein ABI594_12515 [Ginsengibacter sp.]
MSTRCKEADFFYRHNFIRTFAFFYSCVKITEKEIKIFPWQDYITTAPSKTKLFTLTIIYD